MVIPADSRCHGVPRVARCNAEGGHCIAFPIEMVVLPVRAKLPAALRKGPADTYVYSGLKKGILRYVGITRQKVSVREAQHGGKYVLEEMGGPFQRGAARAIEQAQKVLNPQFDNIRNSISPLHKYYDQAVEFGKAWLKANGF